MQRGQLPIAYIDPDLCRTGLVKRVELARSQCGQPKTTSWSLTVFPRTGNLKRSKRVLKVIRDCQKARLANSRPLVCVFAEEFASGAPLISGSREKQSPHFQTVFAIGVK